MLRPNQGRPRSSILSVPYSTSPTSMTTIHTETLYIDGMSCSHCIRAVTEALARMPSVQVHEVTVGSARVSFPEGQRTTLMRTIQEEGYRVRRK